LGRGGEGPAVLDLRPWIEGVRRSVERHNLGEPGAYCRWLWQDEKSARNLGLDPYGCADAANILYTLGCFPRDTGERAAWVAALQGLQDPDTGMFREATHSALHTTAHCTAALELFDAAPLHPLAELEPLTDPASMESFLEALDWEKNPWIDSHRGAGLYAALSLCGAVSPEWEDRYFAWLSRETDPATGLLRSGRVPDLGERGELAFPHLAGTFHYRFNAEHARRPWPHSARLIDTCLAIESRRLFPFCSFVGFAEIDWVYCLSRSSRHTPHRFDQGRAALRRLAHRYLGFLGGIDLERDDGPNDLHALFGALCAVAELQQALPGLIRTEHPLRLVLDRRPFI